MRLIDADKLLEDLKQKRYSKQSLELILSQPEIKAIPIKWIIEWSSQFNKVHSNGITYYEGEGYDGVWDLLEAWSVAQERSDNG